MNARLIEFVQAAVEIIRIHIRIHILLALLLVFERVCVRVWMSIRAVTTNHMLRYISKCIRKSVKVSVARIYTHM